MKLQIINDNPYDQNIYLYIQDNEAVIIDPGDSFASICEAVAKHGVKVIGILLTHGHFDHTLSVNALREHTSAPVYAHENEVPLLADAEINRAGLRGINVSVTPDKTFTHGGTFKFQNGSELKILHTPGHTAGGVCFYDEKNAALFTGDTLFRDTIGRTDMPTGDHHTLITSISEKLFTLPDNTTVYPGHGESSSVAHEKAHNPYF
jgi:glyoxylase-like metal-dependent hydrolase (beta-lactamase superfamily II)